MPQTVSYDGPNELQACGYGFLESNMIYYDIAYYIILHYAMMQYDIMYAHVYSLEGMRSVSAFRASETDPESVSLHL